MPDEIHNQDALNAPLFCPHCGASKRPESEYTVAMRIASERRQAEADMFGNALGGGRLDVMGLTGGMQNAWPYAGKYEPPPPPKPLTGWAAWRWLFGRQWDSWMERISR